MRRSMSRLPILAVSLVLGPALVLIGDSTPLRAQAPAAPRRPPLEAASIDTNDARAYFEFGLKQVAKRPEIAADAFWWAARLDPTWADPVYGRRVALIMANPYLLGATMRRRDDALGSPELRALDSMELRAVSLNPFLYRRLDLEMFRAWIGRGTSGAERNDVDNFVDDAMSRADEWTRAWVAYSRGRFVDAVRLYGSVVDKAKSGTRAEARAELARADFMLGNRADAMRQLALALDEKQAADEKRVVRVYESKAIYEHGIGLLHEMNGAPDSARAAYQHALTEDLSYWPAHRQLGLLALAEGDTATAVQELDQAVQLKGDDPALRYQYGRALAASSRYEEAIAQFRRATELDPDYAAPWFSLARIHDSGGFTAQAIEFYQGYVAHAPRRDAQLAPARERLAALRAEIGAPPDAAASPPLPTKP